MASSFNHNKKRNSGLVYEFIVRRMASQLLDEDKKGYAKTLSLAQRYYSAGAPLAQERELFEAIRKTRGVSEAVARKVMGEVQRRAARLDHKRIEIKKSNLIKEINHSFGKGFYSDHRVPEYRLMASIQMLIDSCRQGGPIMEAVNRIQLEEALVRFMTTTEAPKAKTGGDRVDGLVAALAAKKFGERYGRAFNPDQKRLLERYTKAQMSGDIQGLSRFILTERDRLRTVVNDARALKEIKEDKVMAERLDEARTRLMNLDIAKTDEAVEEVMLFYKLAEELTSNE